MESLNNIWEFLNGKKTAIGSILMIAGQAMEMIPATLPAAKVVSYLGAAISTGGLLHKATK